MTAPGGRLGVALSYPLGAAFGPIIPASLLVIAVTRRRADSHLVFHAVQAACQILWLIPPALVCLGGFVLETARMLFEHGLPPSLFVPLPSQPGPLVVISGGILVGTYPVLILVSLVFARRAWQGRWTVYPPFGWLLARLPSLRQDMMQDPRARRVADDERAGTLSERSE